ncbi:MAG: PIN domain-containing protein [Dehalococcoidia bacterium]|nr:PIN domain-containing protein [Dehalococcoidia bacterium]
MDRVFVDTAAFIAIQNRADQHSEEAVAFSLELANNKVSMVTTNLVLAETYTWLQRHPAAGYGAALAFYRWFAVLSSTGVYEETSRGKKTKLRLVEAAGDRRPISVLFADASMEEDTWRFFTRHGASGATYTDCVSFAVMRMLGLKKAFTFDEHFATAGFERAP